MVRIFLDLVRHPLLAANRQRVVVDVERDVLRSNVRELRLSDTLLIGILIDIDRWGPGSSRHQTFVIASRSRTATIGIGERTIDTILQIGQLAKRIPTDDSHDVSS